MTDSQDPGWALRASRAALRRAAAVLPGLHKNSTGCSPAGEPEAQVEPIVSERIDQEQQLVLLAEQNAALEHRLAEESSHLARALADIESLEAELEKERAKAPDHTDRAFVLERTNQELAAEIQERKRVAIALSAFSQLGQKLHSAHSEKEAAQIIADTAQKLIPHDVCSVSIYAGNNELHRVIEPSAGQRSFRSSLSVPIRNGSRVVGILEIKHVERDAFTIADANTLQSLGDYCGGALERVRTEKALRHLSQSILDAQENERRRVARELHDGVNQAIASIKFRIQTAEQQIVRGDPKWQETCARTKEMLDSVLQQVRRLSRNLRPGELDDFGLVAAVRSACQEFQARTGIEVSFNVSGLQARLAAPVELSLYRIIQEALTNVERHSGAGAVQIELSGEAATVTLDISDNGHGIDPTPSESGRAGLGHLHMRERASLIGGSFAIESSPGRGVRIKVQAPIDARNQHEQPT